MAQPQEYNATIVARQDVHEGLCFLHVAPDAGPFPPFEPGQFVSVGRNVITAGAPALVKRSYSIGSPATERRHVELFVVHVDDGEFTSWLFAQREGSRVWLAPKASGGFTLDGFTRGHDLVLVATGTGVAPFVSMYRTFRNDPPWKRIVIMNGVRLARDLGYRDELEQAVRNDPRLVYLPTATREGTESWAGQRGRVGTLLEPARYESLVGAPLSPDHSHVYLCGNPEMIEELEGVLTLRGFRKHTRAHPGNLHLEKYWTD
ncbi:MAG TPA: ferredoxin--NADP reductase [Candidatus Krumholzibacteria bacterium]